VTKLCFFNFYHNGDLFHSKSFVREVVKHLGRENVLYAHNKDPRAIEDLELQHVRLEGVSDKVKILRLENPDMLLVNTWIGSYFDKYTGECTLNFNMKMWSDIYEDINKTFNQKMVLGPVEDYLPYVDYTKYDLTNVRSFIDSELKPKILFCNGPAMSGQCEYNGDMKDIIGPLAEQHEDKIFLTTQKLENMGSNVIYTGDIIKSDRCDLNEISYLSKYCSLIIGRNSGPFCYASTGENLNDSTKTFHAFGHQQSDCFTMGISTKSNYIFHKYESPGQLYSSIRNLVNKV
jgi:hypothetical protein